MSLEEQTIVVGAGVVGLSISLGLLHRGHSVTVLDGEDSDLRASFGNFGLVWLQGKGANNPAYARWTRESVSAWPTFAEKVSAASGIDLALDQCGGYEFFTNPNEHEVFTKYLSQQAAALGDQFSHEVLTPEALRDRLPGIGPDVVGATFCPLDGHVNPLRLHRALREAVLAEGGRIETGRPVETITRQASGLFKVSDDKGNATDGNRIVLCAGLGSARLGPQMGFQADIRAQRGELLITEKLRAELPFLSSTIRQVDEGGIQIGGTKAEIGPDDSETPEKVAELARHAVTVWPALADAKVIRSWGALRVMTRDGYPIYQKSQSHPGAFLVTCHSGITLASLHATQLADWMDNHPDAPNLEAFDERRFTLS